ncbi:MAG: hypothetical protein J7576_10710 [Siphonobacter aquaeclarae]|nr:hypothetical protein [Siphonobacter aquaeclarae]
MMTEEERISQIKGYQERQPELALTFAQAKFLFENDADTRFRIVPFSTWELLDYEYELYRQILSASQFELFETGWKERQQRTKEQIAESDPEASKWAIGYYGDFLEYTREHFWPEIRQIGIPAYLQRRFDADKTTLIRACYSKYLNEAIAERIAFHFRDYRRFAPLRLKAVEMENDVSRLQPHYEEFYRRADEAVRAVFDFLRKQAQSTEEEILLKLDEVIQRQEKFVEEAFVKHPSMLPISIIPDRRTRKQRQVDMLLNLLLIDISEMPG